MVETIHSQGLMPATTPGTTGQTVGFPENKVGTVSEEILLAQGLAGEMKSADGSILAARAIEYFAPVEADPDLISGTLRTVGLYREQAINSSMPVDNMARDPQLNRWLEQRVKGEKLDSRVVKSPIVEAGPPSNVDLEVSVTVLHDYFYPNKVPKFTLNQLELIRKSLSIMSAKGRPDDRLAAEHVLKNRLANAQNGVDSVAIRNNKIMSASDRLKSSKIVQGGIARMNRLRTKPTYSDFGRVVLALREHNSDQTNISQRHAQ